MNATALAPARKIAKAKPLPSTTVKAPSLIENEASSAATTITFAAELERICDAILVADNKIEMVFDAAEPGDALDTLLDHLAHTLFCDAVDYIRGEQPPTRDQIRQAYDALFPVLACLQGAISLAAGTVGHATLVEAFDILDKVQNDLDASGSLGRLAPAAAKPAGIGATQQCVQDEALEGLFMTSFAILLEVIGILEMAVSDRGNLGEVAYGALRLARGCLAELQVAKTIDDYEMVSAPLGSTLAVLDAANDECDDVVLYGASRLLQQCKESFDATLAEAA